ncbi:MAG TPA: DUF983 domain-containing protein [Gemmatimonadaceae bacterium]|nr:DUF983 domain-containing protein [Gemmatimonadaceae bacterium]
MIGRALVLRCPRCGGRGIRRSWFKFQHACPTCDLVLERGESEDYWLGAYMFNLVAAEFVSVGIAVVIIVAMWPVVPWNFVWALAVVLAIAMPILFFPFSRDLWLAFDLMFRPTDPDRVRHQEAPPRAH